MHLPITAKSQINSTREMGIQPALTAAEFTKPENRSGATPMMEQFIEIKAANLDSLLFYRMGDFYELFFEDAVEASRALGITLTKRGQHQGYDIPMCGVPVHAADDYLQKLIKLGFRVAVCEQMENPAEAKKRGAKSVVRRDVVRLVTPGTITEEKLLSPSESNYLMALTRIKNSDTSDYALAWIDISTGKFRLIRSNENRLLSDIMRIEPKELIVADAIFSDEKLKPTFDVLGRVVQPQPSVLFDSATAKDRVLRFYNISALEGLGDFSRVEMAAISAIISYVEKTQISERPSLSNPEREDAQSTLFIDAATRANLELVKTLSGEKSGSLLAAMNRTVTNNGARQLAENLIAPLVDPVEINLRLDSVAWFFAQTPIRESLRQKLYRSPDMLRALSRLSLNRGGPRDLAAIRSGLQTAGEIHAELNVQDMPVLIKSSCSTLANTPIEILDLLEKKLDEELPILKRDGGFIKSECERELAEMRGLRDESRRIIAGLQLKYASETGIKGLKIKHNNMLGYFIEVTTLNSGPLTNSDEAKAQYIHRQSLANAMRFTTTELSDLETRIANSAGRAQEIELRVFEELRSLCVEHSNTIQKSADALAFLDVCLGYAELAEEQGYCRPIVDDTRVFNITAGRHPVVEQALRQQSSEPFIANNCNLSQNDSQNFGDIWLLTGPNMGGKSTFLRQNALIAIMAQMGSFVPAGSAHIGIVDRLFSRVGASDDLARGRSTFMVEMVETAAILNQASERSLVILDEIGRGTATFDGLSIAWAAVEHLHEVNKCRGLFATHFHELTVLSEKLARLANVTMRVKEFNGEVVFLHEVTKGSADRSYGIQVAKLAGLPAAVIHRASEVLSQLEEGDRQNPSHKLIDDLPLFSNEVPKQSQSASTKDSKIHEAILALNPDELTPRDAMDVLYDLKKLIN